MKQLIQHIRSGQSTIVDVPAPHAEPGRILVHNGASLVSAGTERMVVDFAEKNLLQKARSRPDLVRQTLDKVQREGLISTLEAVRNRLDQPMSLGYSSAGTVIAKGEDIYDFKIGDRVACAGGGYAVHAEVISVPRNLVVKIPESEAISTGFQEPTSNGQGKMPAGASLAGGAPSSVSLDEAAFTTLGAVALQGVRLAEIKLGEIVAVIGLGLLGQLTVQLLKAAGCLVVGMDLQPERAELARRLGVDVVTVEAEELSGIVHGLSSGHGADAVLITAETSSNQPVALAGKIAREKGLVVAVGTVGMSIPRKIYYEKELGFRVSRSYGPGRYDPDYEEKGHDYPYGYIRWTEQRNMQAFVQLLAEGKLNLHPLITHRFPISEAAKAYELITGKSGETFLGVLLTYSDTPDLERKVVLHQTIAQARQITSNGHSERSIDRVKLGVIGAGNFANATLLPVLKGLDNLEQIGIASRSGISARSSADRFGFAYCTTDVQQLLDDPAINTVAIVTRNHLHARQVVAALKVGKKVFVEKPLCLTEQELVRIIQTYQARQANGRTQEGVVSSPSLMVGYNRRFAAFVVELKEFLQRVSEPLSLHYRINAGYLSPDHWLHDPAQGGGRLLGEACHFIDLLIYLADSAPQRVITRALPDNGRYLQDNLLITLEFANGSLGTVSYLANGDKGFGKEMLEVFGGGLSARLDDYRSLVVRNGSKRIKRVARLRQDKGHRMIWQAWIAHLIGGGPAPLSLADIVCSTQATIAAQQSLQNESPYDINVLVRGMDSKSA